MNKMKIAVLSTCLMILAGGAVAQSDAEKKAEDLRRSSEMMKPQTQEPAGASNRGTSMPTPVSEADRKAEEARINAEMMKPRTSAPPGAMTPGAASTPISEADRKAEQERLKAEQMKPR